MTDPPLQSFLRFIAIDIHKHYLMIGAIDAHKQVVLVPRRVELSRWPKWAQANLLPTDAVVIEATTNAWAIYDLLAPLVGRAVVVHHLHVIAHERTGELVRVGDGGRAEDEGGVRAVEIADAA